MTIGDLMGLAVGVALLLGGFRSILSGDGTEASVLVILLGGLPLLAASRDLFDALLGVGCPACGHPRMARVWVRPFGPRYYRCSRCGARRKRSIAGLWRDADGPEDAQAFEQKVSGGTYQPGPDLEFGPDPGSTTAGRLLRGKRERRIEENEDAGSEPANDPEATPPTGDRG